MDRYHVDVDKPEGAGAILLWLRHSVSTLEEIKVSDIRMFLLIHSEGRSISWLEIERHSQLQNSSSPIRFVDCDDDRPVIFFHCQGRVIL